MEKHLIVLWDPESAPDSNAHHIQCNGITPQEVETLFHTHTSKGTSLSSGNPMVFGYLPDGRYVTVVYEHVEDFPWIVYPITAYEVPEPRPPQRKRRRR